jgi:toxin CcdB
MRDGSLLLDGQTDRLSHIDSRLVAPLLTIDDAPPRRAQLIPTFMIADHLHVMVTQFAATVRRAGPRTKSRISHASAWRSSAHST